MPFSSGGVFISYKERIEPIYQRLDSGEIDINAAEKEAIKVMETYCDVTYPLN